MKYLTFPTCDCRFEIIEDETPEGVMPLIKFDVDDVPRDCRATWQLLAEGRTKGVFQLESGLGRQWTKKLRPESLEHMAALSAILRPGCLEAVSEDGVSMTAHYCKRKNGEEEIVPYHPVVDELLASTFSVMTYQEQAMKLAEVVAGFTLIEADRLRKAAGKKSTKEMAIVGELFLAGCERMGIVSKQQAEGLFSWIEKSQRYSFNKCVAGSTVVRRFVRNRRTGFGLPVEEMYRIRNDIEYAKATSHNELRKKWKLLGHYGIGLSMCPDGRIRPNIIRDIQPAGKRPVFRMTLLNGAFIDVTDNHKFPTSEGELTLSEIMARNDVSVFVCGKYEKTTKRYGWSDVKGYPSHEMGIAKIEPLGEMETYDVTMDGPNHTFVTDSNIVTCNSHAHCYGVRGYKTAFIKAHFPVAFYAAWLKNAHRKMNPHEEIQELVNDARLSNVPIEVPDFRRLSPFFQVIDRRTIQFGLSDVKGVGDALLKKIEAAVAESETKLGKKLADFTWLEFLTHCSRGIGASAVRKFIAVGAFSWFGLARKRAMEELKAWDGLTEKEQDFARTLSVNSMVELLRATALPKKEGGGAANKKRTSAINSQADLLERPPTSLEDSPFSIAHDEEELLGISLTFSRVDECDQNDVNANCKDLAMGRKGNLLLCVQINQVRDTVTKRGQTPGAKMAYLNVSDASGAFNDVVVFPSVYAEYASLLNKGDIVYLNGELEKTKSFSVKKVLQKRSA